MNSIGPWFYIIAPLACLLSAVAPSVSQDTPLHKPIPRSVELVGPYSKFYPHTEDEELLGLFSNPKVRWYTHREMPPVFQHDFGNPYFVSIYKDIGPGGPRYSNGNGEWPWAHPATAQDDGLTKAIVGALIPSQPEVFNVTLPMYSIVTGPDYFAVESAGARRGINWKFPVGTEFIELNLNHISGEDYCYKVHRMTMQPNGEWLFRVYRPWDNQDEYERDTGTKVEDLGRYTMRSPHRNAAFKKTIENWKLAPPISPAKAAELLNTKSFKLCKDDSFIPTTNATDQVWPKGYLGAFITNATNQEDCRTCHRQVLEEVRKFDTGEWYGHIRGGGTDAQGAGVFSWYPRF